MKPYKGMRIMRMMEMKVIEIMVKKREGGIKENKIGNLEMKVKEKMISR
uniref:Uncharacterized protein n=1 Tax=Cucumis melo TaxID=3656 RepID=A0A9I9E2I6_CUCME